MRIRIKISGHKEFARAIIKIAKKIAKEIIIVVVILSGSILFHEVGHLLAFRHNTIDIETVSVGFPIGGFSLVLWKDSQGTKYQITPFLLTGYTAPTEEGWKDFENLELTPKIGILAIGPLFNFILAATLVGLYLPIMRKNPKRFTRVFEEIKFASYLNLLLGIGNLIVVYPGIDGGRILQLFITPYLGEKAVWANWGLGFLGAILFLEKIRPWLKRIYKLEE